MKPSEAAVLLAKIAAFDRRTLGEADAHAWAEVLTAKGVSLADAMLAVTEHYSATRDFAMPADVINRVATIRRARLRAAGTPPIPGGLSWSQEKRWRALWCCVVKDGLAPEDAAERANQAVGVREQVGPARPDRVRALLRGAEGAFRIPEQPGPQDAA